MHRALLALSVTLLLAGCATPDRDARLTVGASHGSDVVALYGQPGRVWPEADGGRTLEYASQPMGLHCYLVRLGPDDRLIAIVDGLSAAGRSRVQPGMTPEQVSRLLGQERSRVFFNLSGEDVWDWTIEPDQSGYGMRFNVHFKDGVVVRTTQSMVFQNRLFPMAD
jgi:hypothetical protein